MNKEYDIKVTTQPMHKGAMAALFFEKGLRYSPIEIE